MYSWLADAIYECRHPLFILEAKVLNVFLLSDLPEVEFHESGFRYSDTRCIKSTQQRIWDIYRYLFIQVTLIARYASSQLQQDTTLRHFKLSFVSLYECCCIIVFDSIIYLNQDSIQLLLQYIRLITGCYCKCAFYHIKK